MCSEEAMDRTGMGNVDVCSEDTDSMGMGYMTV